MEKLKTLGTETGQNNVRISNTLGDTRSSETFEKYPVMNETLSDNLVS